jgi:hypothetical protein
MDSDAYKAGKIPVDTAQCDRDTILGFGNLTSSVLEMDPNVCKCHPLGADSFPRHAEYYAPVIQSYIFLQESLLPTIRTFTLFRHVLCTTPSAEFYCE